MDIAAKVFGPARNRLGKKAAALVRVPPTPQDWEHARPLLRPVLRPPVHNPEYGVVSRPVLSYLAEMLVVEGAVEGAGEGSSVLKYVGREDLAAWNVTAEEAFAAAHHNLARPTRLDGSTDRYVTSLPLLDGWLAALHRSAGARPLAFPAGTGVLLLAYETADPDEIRTRIHDAEREWTESARPICPAPITVDDQGSLVLYEVPADHPAYAAVKHASILLAMSAYGPQTEYLRDVAGTGDPRPASLKGFRSPSGEEFTATTWTDGLDSLLPQADLVFFPQDGAPALRIPWDVVAEEVSLLPEEGFHPARYRVSAWPAPEVMERMKARATVAA
ncbi:MAG: hypothetical protein HOV87_04260 [Catenulispora sp.]|nr:hypothetical protein [Catenulispora sp.]